MTCGKGHYGDSDGGSVHVDGTAQGDADGIEVLIQSKALAQGHIHRNIGGRRTCEEGTDGTLAQTQEHKRIWIASKHYRHDDGIQHQGYREHASHKEQK